MKIIVATVLAILMLFAVACQRDGGAKQAAQTPGEKSRDGQAGIGNALSSEHGTNAVPESSLRFYFTGALSSVEVAQVLSMRADGSGLLQHTAGGEVKYGIYECTPLDRVYFLRDEALAMLIKGGTAKTVLINSGTQYYSPRCSPDGKYLSLTAWDKESEHAYIEVYNAASMTRLQRWEGEFASWARDRNVVVYRVLVQDEKPPHVDVYIRDMDDNPNNPELLYSQKIGEYIYDVTEPMLVGPGPRDVVFRVYDEHEYFYYLNKLGSPFVKTRGGNPLVHHDVYGENFGDSLEQGALSISPDGTLAVMEEHPWNTPPSIYLVDMKTRDSSEIAEGFNPVWSRDSKLVLFSKDPKHYAEYHEMQKRGFTLSHVYPQGLNGYEIYVYDIGKKKEYRLTNDDLYEGFL